MIASHLRPQFFYQSLCLFSLFPLGLPVNFPSEIFRSIRVLSVKVRSSSAQNSPSKDLELLSGADNAGIEPHFLLFKRFCPLRPFNLLAARDVIS